MNNVSLVIQYIIWLDLNKLLDIKFTGISIITNKRSLCSSLKGNHVIYLLFEVIGLPENRVTKRSIY